MIDLGTTSKFDKSFCLGFEFHAIVPITVTHLGRFIPPHEPLRTTSLHANAGLWNDANNLLVSAMIPACSSPERDSNGNEWLFAEIAPMRLSPGDYVIGVQTFPDDDSGEPTFTYESDVTMGPGLTWTEGRAEEWNGGLDHPDGICDPFYAKCYFGPNFKYHLEQITLCPTKPLTQAVFQRNDQDIAKIPVEGTIETDDSINSVEARYLLTSDSSQFGPWQVIDNTQTTYSGTIDVPIGGWYTIEVRALDDTNSVVDEASTEKIGVGEVFITAGQSNSANYGTPKMDPNDKVSAWTGSGWQHACDPQPIATGTGGSPWPRLGNLLVSELDVPVGFISVGVGGTEVARWVPDACDLYPRIENAIEDCNSYGYGLRAILWHQGESDSIDHTSTEDYAARLTSIIERSREDAGWNIPWGVAIAAFHTWESSTEEAEEKIREAQQRVIENVENVFMGPNTDNLGPEYRIDEPWDGVHFNNEGLFEHAEGWRNAFYKEFFTCDFNLDNVVDFEDLAFLADYWGEVDCFIVSECEIADINGDGIVAFNDLVECVENWLAR